MRNGKALAWTEVVRTTLRDPIDPEVIHRLVAPDTTYVSLNDNKPELRQIMTWAGKRTGSAVLHADGRASPFQIAGVAAYWGEPDGKEVER